jgi:hypothetical protein
VRASAAFPVFIVLAVLPSIGFAYLFVLYRTL